MKHELWIARTNEWANDCLFALSVHISDLFCSHFSVSLSSFSLVSLYQINAKFFLSHCALWRMNAILFFSFKYAWCWNEIFNIKLKRFITQQKFHLNHIKSTIIIKIIRLSGAALINSIKIFNLIEWKLQMNKLL